MTRKRRQPSLFLQIFLPNAAVLAVMGTALILSRATVRSSRVTTVELGLLLAGLAALVVVNSILIRRAVAPVERLTESIARIAPYKPGQRVALPGGSAETAQLTRAFNAMLDRLEHERRNTAKEMLSAQEGERIRLARELHDEIAQSITALMLAIDHAARRADPGVGDELRSARETARALNEELRRIVRRLRPEALDDLGLSSALLLLSERFSQQTGIPVDRRINSPLPPAARETELVIYRVAQESLTNVARHSQASQVLLELYPSESGLTLQVSDDGRGLDGAQSGAGIVGMRERALLINGAFDLGSGSDGGVTVKLVAPLDPDR